VIVDAGFGILHGSPAAAVALRAYPQKAPSAMAAMEEEQQLAHDSGG
jgi:hypothetical protein